VARVEYPVHSQGDSGKVSLSGHEKRAPARQAGELGHCQQAMVSTIIRAGLSHLNTNGALNMNRKELVDALAAKTESTKADAERAVGAMIDIISGTLKKGDSLTLVGFGTFEVRKRAARTGRNPKTGEELKIKAAKVPAFKPGATLKALVNGAKK
jgi:DNA-binding protein HU-beta